VKRGLSSDENITSLENVRIEVVMTFRGPCLMQSSSTNTYIVDNTKYGLYASDNLDLFVFYFRNVYNKIRFHYY